ncbi:sulfotransferase domain-containing protein [Priestia megaterium]|uniref:sulfotransferase domain-containing protein n=1 Tax=Priestia megaterium TaxID=1404 RepID=UPI0034591101
MTDKNEAENYSSRHLPDYLIIGTQKGGSTSLYNYLIKHPDILPSSKKELHFFDKMENYKKGIGWYQKQFSFPISSNQKKITGEATPNYLSDSLAPKRIARDLPKTTKFIVLLRNPIDRAYSNYQMNVKRGLEQCSFEEAIVNNEKRLKDKFSHITRTHKKQGADQWVYPYITRGVYIKQLKTWMKLFSKNHFLILKSEDLFSKPQKVVNRAIQFLELDENKLNLEMFDIYHKGKYSDEMSQKTRNILVDYYRPYNQSLEKLLDMKFNWDH